MSALQAGVAVAKLSGASKVSQISQGSKSSVHSNGENTEDEPLLTWKDLLTNPCLFVPLIILTAAAAMGCIGLIFFGLGGESNGFVLVCAFVLLGSGLLAAFEVRALGTLSQQIEYLKVIRKQLEASTQALESQVGGIESENLELEENVRSFRARNEDLAMTVDDFNTKNDELRDLHEQLEKQSEILKEETRGIRVQSEKLNATVTAMGEQHDHLTESLKDFDELRATLNSMAEESGEQFSDLIYKTSETFQKMDDLVQMNEKVLLHQLIADVEMIDDTSGMQLKEYKRFVARLPKRYKAIISSKGITFETFDTDNDGVIDVKEIRELVENLTSEVTKSQERKRRPGV